jgi:hypothetical protein
MEMNSEISVLQKKNDEGFVARAEPVSWRYKYYGIEVKSKWHQRMLLINVLFVMLIS